MTEKHTKGPLQVLITDGESMKGANCVLISDNGDQIARCSAPFPFDTSWDERDANAHRLALAWNCHDELLEALRECATRLNSSRMIMKDYGLRAMAGESVDKALATIAKATGASHD